MVNLLLGLGCLVLRLCVYSEGIVLYSSAGMSSAFALDACHVTAKGCDFTAEVLTIDKPKKLSFRKYGLRIDRTDAWSVSPWVQVQGPDVQAQVTL